MSHYLSPMIQRKKVHIRFKFQRGSEEPLSKTTTNKRNKINKRDKINKQTPYDVL